MFKTKLQNGKARVLIFMLVEHLCSRFSGSEETHPDYKMRDASQRFTPLGNPINFSVSLIYIMIFECKQITQNASNDNRQSIIKHVTFPAPFNANVHLSKRNHPSHATNKNQTTIKTSFVCWKQGQNITQQFYSLCSFLWFMTTLDIFFPIGTWKNPTFLKKKNP